MAMSIEGQEYLGKGVIHLTIQEYAKEYAGYVTKIKQCNDLCDNSHLLWELGDVALDYSKKLKNSLNDIPEDVSDIRNLVERASGEFMAAYERTKAVFEAEGSYERWRTASKDDIAEILAPYEQDIATIFKSATEIDTAMKQGLLLLQQRPDRPTGGESAEATLQASASESPTGTAQEVANE